MWGCSQWPCYIISNGLNSILTFEQSSHCFHYSKKKQPWLNTYLGLRDLQGVYILSQYSSQHINREWKRDKVKEANILGWQLEKKNLKMQIPQPKHFSFYSFFRTSQVTFCLQGNQVFFLFSLITSLIGSTNAVLIQTRLFRPIAWPPVLRLVAFSLSSTCSAGEPKQLQT